MKKQTRRRTVVPLPPPGLRPKLTRDTAQKLSINHWTVLDTIAHGGADEGAMWQYMGGALTWLYVAEEMARRHPTPDFRQARAEMDAQARVAASLAERFERTGRVGFSGTEYQTAKTACAVMDNLAEIVDWPTADICATRAQMQIDRRVMA